MCIRFYCLFFFFKQKTAYEMRISDWSSDVCSSYLDPEPGKASDLKRWGRQYWEAVHPFNLEGAYVNFMMPDEGASRVQASYGANYERLAAVKRRYDPENLFRVNQNIPPAAP